MICLEYKPQIQSGFPVIGRFPKWPTANHLPYEATKSSSHLYSFTLVLHIVFALTDPWDGTGIFTYCTWMVDFYGKRRKIYRSSHGSYGLHTISKKIDALLTPRKSAVQYMPLPYCKRWYHLRFPTISSTWTSGYPAATWPTRFLRISRAFRRCLDSWRHDLGNFVQDLMEYLNKKPLLDIDI